MSVPTTPPPPYSPTGANTQWTAILGAVVMIPGTAVTPTNTWTRKLECQTDTSYILIDSAGFWLYYSKDEGRAAITPTLGQSERKYFCKDGSKIVLSRDGWLHYDNDRGTQHTYRLQWSIDPIGKGWYARGPSAAPVPTPTATPARPPSSGKVAHRRYDSGVGHSASQYQRRKDDGDSEEDKDPYDPLKKYGL